MRVDDRRSGTDLPPGPGGLWWNYGGITREVYLRAVQRADISAVRVRPVLRCPSCAAEVQEQAVIRNVTATTQRVRLRGSYGRRRLNFGQATIPPHSTWTASAAVRLAHPHLWSIDDPHLYRATLALLDGAGRRLASYATASGVRSREGRRRQAHAQRASRSPCTGSACTSRTRRSVRRSIPRIWRA